MLHKFDLAVKLKDTCACYVSLFLFVHDTSRPREYVENAIIGRKYSPVSFRCLGEVLLQVRERQQIFD